MNFKSIRFSIYSLVLFVGLIFGIVFLFKFNILIGFAGIVLLLIPAKLQRIAIDEANGKVDKFIAKYLVLILAVAISFLAIMSVAFWMKVL